MQDNLTLGQLVEIIVLLTWLEWLEDHSLVLKRIVESLHGALVLILFTLHIE